MGLPTRHTCKEILKATVSVFVSIKKLGFWSPKGGFQSSTSRATWKQHALKRERERERLGVMSSLMLTMAAGRQHLRPLHFPHVPFPVANGFPPLSFVIRSVQPMDCFCRLWPPVWLPCPATTRHCSLLCGCFLPLLQGLSRNWRFVFPHCSVGVSSLQSVEYISANLRCRFA